MQDIVLYCKSYRNDVLRVKRLAQSVQQFNRESIPFYVSVPASDLPLFHEHLAGFSVQLIGDEEIVCANPSLDWVKINALPGTKSQQIIKSEFWRLGLSDTYLCIDSDCVFIRQFNRSNFIMPDGCPHSVVHEAKELLQFAVNHGLEKVYNNFHIERSKMMEIWGRTGYHYDFGPTPFIWSSQVWRSLDEKFLKPRNMNFYDAIMLFPSEIQWYGEALLKFHAIPVMPIEPLFKVYHIEPQFIAGRQQGETIERLAKNFMGVCYQSNWEKNFDLDKKPLFSRIGRWLRRNILRRYT